MQTLAYHDSAKVDCHLDGVLLTKDLGAGWAVGSGNGGLDTGTVAGDSSYHAHLITDGAVLDVLFSAAAVNPVLPAGWSLTGRVLGAVVTDANGAVRPFDQVEDEFQLRTAVTVCNTAPNGSATLRDLPVPFGTKVKAIVYADFKGLVEGWGQLADPDRSGAIGNTVSFKARRLTGFAMVGGEYAEWTNASAQIHTGDSYSAATLTLILKGWIDPRARHAA